MNLYISHKNLRPKKSVSDLPVAATDELHQMIADDLAEAVAASMGNIVKSLERESVIWDQDDFNITIRSDDGETGSRSEITAHVVER